MKKSVAALIVSGSLLVSPAYAAWGYIDNEDAFSDETTHIAVGAEGGYGFGFRCQSGDDLVVIFITPESVDSDLTHTLNAASPELLVRVDKETALTLPTKFEVNNDGNLSALTSEGELSDLARSVAGAGERVAVAIQILGERMHVKDFSVSGSTNAVDQLIEGCGLSVD